MKYTPLVFWMIFITCSMKNKINEKIPKRNIEENSKEFNVIDSIASINFDNYTNKQISDLLDHSLMVKYNKYEFIQEPPRCLWYLELIFDDPNSKRFLKVNIYPDMSSLQYIHRCINYPKEIWDMASLKKEKIAKVEFFMFD